MAFVAAVRAAAPDLDPDADASVGADADGPYDWRDDG
jgi:hypothetical protein